MEGAGGRMTITKQKQQPRPGRFELTRVGDVVFSSFSGYVDDAVLAAFHAALVRSIDAVPASILVSNALDVDDFSHDYTSARTIVQELKRRGFQLIIGVTAPGP